MSVIHVSMCPSVSLRLFDRSFAHLMVSMTIDIFQCNSKYTSSRPTHFRLFLKTVNHSSLSFLNCSFLLPRAQCVLFARKTVNGDFAQASRGETTKKTKKYEKNPLIKETSHWNNWSSIWLTLKHWKKTHWAFRSYLSWCLVHKSLTECVWAYNRHWTTCIELKQHWVLKKTEQSIAMKVNYVNPQRGGCTNFIAIDRECDGKLNCLFTLKLHTESQYKRWQPVLSVWLYVSNMMHTPAFVNRCIIKCSYWNTHYFHDR